MSQTAARAVQPPAHAPAPPVQRRPEPAETEADRPQRLLGSLASVLAVQRKCAACAAEDDDRMPVQPKLEVGPVDDPYEREADDIAGRVMAMRAPAVQRIEDTEEETVQARGADAALQRIEDTKEDTEEDTVQPLRGALVQRACASCGGEETPVQPKLEVGPVDDPYEREADDIAGRVMAMRAPAVQRIDDIEEETVQPLRATALQRKCAACGDGDEMPVQPRRAARASVQRAPSALLADDPLRDLADTPRMKAGGGQGGEHIAANSMQLTSGGSPLADSTRDYFETRMGRDLSSVRIHTGAASDGLNRSISARAFTYQNHIWLSRQESEAPSFTMAHELAHVLQQTQPGSVRPRPKVRRAASEIISDTLYFMPQRDSFDEVHEKAVAHAVSNTTNMLGEVRVPNANRSGQTLVQGGGLPGTGFGYADLVLADKSSLWGIGFVAASPGSTPWPWYVAGKDQPLKPASLGYSRKGTLYIGTSKHAGRDAQQKYFDASHPRWKTTDFVRTADKAPGSYEIGDMKFAGDKDRKSAATKQTAYYAQGFNFAKNNFNRIVAQSDAVKAKSNSVNRTGSSALDLKATSFAAKQMTTDTGKTGFSVIGENVPLQLCKYDKTILGKDKCDAVTGFTYTGKSYYRQNPDSKHLWEYVFWPDEIKELDNPAARTKRRESLTNASKTLYDQMVASPTGKKLVTPRRVAPSAAPPRVQRAKPKKKLPPKADPFKAQYPDWKTKQKAFTKTFSTYTDIRKGTGKKEVAQLAFDTALQNTMKLLGGQVPDGRKAVLSTTALSTAQREFNQAELIEGRSGRMLGVMRHTFGETFIKALNIYERLKTKFNDFLKGPKKARKSGGRIGRAIMKVGGVIFGAIIKHMLPQIGAYLVSCVEEGFKALMKSIMEIDFSKYTDEIENKIVKKYNEFAAQIEAKIEEAANDIKTRFGEIYEKVLDAWETAKTLLTIARHVFNVARIAACAAGGLETLGISCVVAGVDYILGLFDVSPSEYLLSHLLSSCVAQDLIAEFILGRSIIRNLPKSIAETVREKVKAVLPDELKPIICDKIGDAPDLPDKSEIPCQDIETPGGSKRGSDLTSAPPQFPREMQKRRATRREIKKYGRLDTGLIDAKGKVDRSKLPEELKKALKPEDAPPPGTPNVWDPPTGEAPPKVTENKPAAPKQPEPKAEAPKPGSSGGGKQGGGEGTGAGGEKQSVREGKIANPTGRVSAYMTILPGPSGGFSYGKKNGKTIYAVYIWVQTSAHRTYGPLPIEIRVWNVVKTKTGDWIQFEPKTAYVLSKGQREIEIEAKRNWARLRKDK